MEGQKKRPLGSAATDQPCLLQKHLETRQDVMVYKRAINRYCVVCVNSGELELLNCLCTSYGHMAFSHNNKKSRVKASSFLGLTVLKVTVPSVLKVVLLNTSRVLVMLCLACQWAELLAICLYALTGRMLAVAPQSCWNPTWLFIRCIGTSRVLVMLFSLSIDRFHCHAIKK